MKRPAFEAQQPNSTKPGAQADRVPPTHRDGKDSSANGSRGTANENQKNPNQGHSKGADDKTRYGK